MMDKKYVNKWAIIEAKDEDLGIRYKKSSSKGTRPFLIIGKRSEEEFFVLPFNKKTSDRVKNPHLIEIDEEVDSLLNLKSEPKAVSYKKLSLIKWRGEIHSVSITKIEEHKKRLGIIWFEMF